MDLFNGTKSNINDEPDPASSGLTVGLVVLLVIMVLLAIVCAAALTKTLLDRHNALREQLAGDEEGGGAEMAGYQPISARAQEDEEIYAVVAVPVAASDDDTSKRFDAIPSELLAVSEPIAGDDDDEDDLPVFIVPKKKTAPPRTETEYASPQELLGSD